MFRSEVETHSEVLSAALLALERSPSDTSRIDEMMRAAHSIKGAARVVGVDPAVGVAHVMEDCFVAAQKGAIGFSSGGRRCPAPGGGPAGQDFGRDAGPKRGSRARVQRSRRKRLVAELQAVLSGSGTSGGVSPRVEGSPTVAPRRQPAVTRSETAAHSRTGAYLGDGE